MSPDCTQPHDNPRDDTCGCFDRYGFESLSRWCPTCRAAYDAWCDDQAEAARLTDRACGLGWQWEHLATTSEN